MLSQYSVPLRFARIREIRVILFFAETCVEFYRSTRGRKDFVILKRILSQYF